MKRIAMAAALAAGIVAASYAAEQTEPSFQTANEKFAQGQWSKANWRKAKIVMSQKDGKQIFKTDSTDPKIDGAVYFTKKIKVKPGQKLQISLKASGQGIISPGVWGYDVKGKYILARLGTAKLAPESKEFSFTYVIPEKTDAVLTSLHIRGGAEAEVERLEYRIEEPQAN